MPTFGSLFAGIGGIDLGLERAGWETRWQVEIDPFCTQVLARHWPDVARYGDIRGIDWSTVEPVDLLAGGFPCQPISSAGKQLAQADPRWLWPEFARAIRALRPRHVLVENVRNLLSVNGGSAFGEVLGDLAASGYDAQWDCIPAAAVGAPHRRDRLWIMAHTDNPRPLLDREGDARGWQRGGGPASTGPAGDRGSSELAHTDDARLQGHRRLDPRWHGPGEQPPGSSGGAIEGRGFPQSRLGRAAHGPADWLDRIWPARPGQEQFDWEPPRIAQGSRQRINRLKALGNAVVPQVAEVIGRQLLASIEAAA